MKNEISSYLCIILYSKGELSNQIRLQSYQRFSSFLHIWHCLCSCRTLPITTCNFEEKISCKDKSCLRNQLQKCHWPTKTRTTELLPKQMWIKIQQSCPRYF